MYTKLLIYFANIIRLFHGPIKNEGGGIVPVSSFSAARRICERGNWTVTNLSLQKILYLIHMIHVGRTGGQPLVKDMFEAWDYGPVVPELYHRVKIFGDRPIQDILFSAPIISTTDEGRVIDEGCDWLLSKKPAELVAMTHWKDGAWAKNYMPGMHNIVIPDEDILDEYRCRTEQRAI
jgi:uncharacterized phage-associated protein